MRISVIEFGTQKTGKLHRRKVGHSIASSIVLRPSRVHCEIYIFIVVGRYLCDLIKYGTAVVENPREGQRESECEYKDDHYNNLY